RAEALHRRVVPTRTDPSHRPEHAVPGDGLLHFLRTKLRPSIAVQDASDHVAPPGDGAVQGGHGQAGLHPGVDRIPNDPARVDVLDRAQVQLPFGRPVLGDVGQPQLVRAHGGEVPLDEIVVHWRSGLAVPTPAILADGAGPATG